MKFKLIVLAVLALTFAALAPTVSAQSTAFERTVSSMYETVNFPMRMAGQANCDMSNPGSPEWMSWCQGIVVDDYGRRIGTNAMSVRGQRARGYRADELRRSRYMRERYDRYYPSYGYGGYGSYGGGYYGGYGDYGYGGYGGYGYGPDIELSGRNVGAVLGGIAGGIATRNSRSGWIKAGGIVGGAVLGGVLGNKVDQRNDRRYEQPSSPERGESEEGENPQATPAPIPPPAQSNRETVAPETLTGTVYVKNGWFCNDTQGTVVIHVNGNPVGKLASGQMVEVASLPTGKLGYKPMQ